MEMKKDKDNELTEKEQVWDRLKHGLPKGRLVSPGVSVRVVDIAWFVPAGMRRGIIKGGQEDEQK